MMFARLPRPPRALVRAAVRGVVYGTALAAALAIAACSSPSSRFYTLGGADSAAAGANGAASAVARTGAAPAWLIEVAPVNVPPQVARNQLVVQSGPTQVQLLEQERWASLPGDEIRRALSTNLTQQLGTLDTFGTAHPDDVAVYRIAMNVQRFESWPGSHALIDAVWSVRAVRSNAVMTCRSVVGETVGGGYDALVDGHRRALAEVSTQIAIGVRAMAAAAVVTTATTGRTSPSARPAAAPVVPPCPSAETATGAGA
ncbi:MULTISPECIES: PqiC family protein [Paraburkholderia]|uniref:Membrane integrity-associated transporter subunit PqiC n=1 Tax=Paraburkholderia podalyriae TaxID=1938811 RepID=A0ABR7PKG3_9BURK|nr:PqiC family protein [Paraburkholderia podalyriae]MBC8746800.1 membrane integrity-associated transporter subunit PqiC [Paraburkholderia podalyriae]